ncbi:MAG: transketolase [Deltaproteobacteria bacterium]|jgi:transketolase|nr:transketolase [Deltaproteobacteria bacterium]
MKASLFNRKDEASVNTLRLYSADMVETAKSGHPGMPLGAAPLIYVLWTRFLRHDPTDPGWPDRDRFIMSPGHGSALLYAILHFTGYGLSLDDLKAFRQPHSKTPGHPELGATPGVEATTGPLGQGFGMAVGLALAERHLASTFNRPGYPLFDHHTYALVSDGDVMEGVACEAASMAGSQGLRKLICIYDDNHVTIEGPTELTFTEDVRERFQSYDWQVIVVSKGDDLPSIYQALENAKNDLERPSLIMARTKLGAGSPKEGRPEAHGSPLGPEALEKTREFYGFAGKGPFYVDARVTQNFLDRAAPGTELRRNWDKLFESYGKEYPEERKELVRRLKGELPSDIMSGLGVAFPKDKPVATRAASGVILNALADKMPELIGGSADLAPSNNTNLKDKGSLLPLNPTGRNIHFGIREAAMGAILNGLALSGAFIPYGGTFLVFSDYLRPALRLSALMGLRVIHILTHDSVGVGEDGPTHQPVEHLASLRAIPRLLLLRPADAYETLALYPLALAWEGPSAFALSRQNLRILHPDEFPDVLEGPAKGGYVLREAAAGSPEAIIIATGSEVQLALSALEGFSGKDRVRLVSMPSTGLFEAQDKAYRESVLPPSVGKRLVIEAGSPFGWDRYLGPQGRIISVNDFGFSGPAGAIFKELGFSDENVRAVLGELLG